MKDYQFAAKKIPSFLQAGWYRIHILIYDKSGNLVSGVDAGAHFFWENGGCMFLNSLQSEIYIKYNVSNKLLYWDKMYLNIYLTYTDNNTISHAHQ